MTVFTTCVTGSGVLLGLKVFAEEGALWRGAAWRGAAWRGAAETTDPALSRDEGLEAHEQAYWFNPEQKSTRRIKTFLFQCLRDTF